MKARKRPPKPRPSGNGGSPITDVNTLPIVSTAVAGPDQAGLRIRSAQSAASPAAAEALEALAALVDRPGTERWFVKTGQDDDRVKVGKNVLLATGADLGARIVEATVEELSSLPRPPGLENPNLDPPAFSKARDGQAEISIWRIEAKILAVKHETDGDYHLVLQGVSGAEMVGEIPTPATAFVGDSPWLQNIGQARQQLDAKLISQLSPAAFALPPASLTVLKNRYAPLGAMLSEPTESPGPAMSFVTPPPGSSAVQPVFQTAVNPTAVRLTGIGFFDRFHGQTGAAPNIIELLPVLKVEFR